MVSSQTTELSDASSSYQPTSNSDVPVGLVGESPTTTVILDGVKCKALLDTGSQVTCVSNEFYRTHLSHRQLKPLSDLGLKGAGGGYSVPYLGYISVNLTPEAREAGSSRRVNTLVLVLASCGDVPLLVGTNTRLLQVLLRDCRRLGGKRFVGKLGVSKPWAAAYRIAASQGRCSRDGALGPLKLSQHTTVLPGSTQDLMCDLSNALGREAQVLVEPDTSVPGSIVVEPFLATTSTHGPARICVKVTNQSQQTVQLHKGRVIGQVFLPSQVERLGEINQISTSDLPFDPQGLASPRGMETAHRGSLNEIQGCICGRRS